MACWALTGASIAATSVPFLGTALGWLPLSVRFTAFAVGGLAQLCFTVCAVTVGFFLVNFPFWKLFLGDGGAYLLGVLLAWLAVTLVHRN